MALTKWRSLSSTGAIADLPATGFRYKLMADFEVYLNEDEAPLGGLTFSGILGAIPVSGLVTKTFTRRWKVRIVDPTGSTVFAQEVQVRYTLVALTQSVFGLTVLGMFTWWTSGERITTTVCGHPLAAGEAPETLGAEQGYCDPGGGSDYTDRYAVFLNDWISPVYLLPIPAGSRFVIDFHNIGLSGLRTSYGSIQTQTVTARSACYRNPRDGLMVLARPTKDGFTVSCWSAPNKGLNAPERVERRWYSTLHTSPGYAVWVPYEGGSRLALVWEGYGGILYAESSDKSQLPDEWEGRTMILTGHRLLGACRDRTGILYLLTRNSEGKTVGYLVSRSSKRGQVQVGPPVECVLEDGTPLSLSQVAYMGVSRGVVQVVVDRGDEIDYYEGHNGMLLWREVQVRGKVQGGA